MTLQELYAQIDGDYNQAIERLRMDKLISRFIVRFLDDKSCKGLSDAWARGDEKAAFEAAHTAKGVCANLSLTKLASEASEICELLRPGNEGTRVGVDIDALVAKLDADYDATIEAISAYAASL